MKRVISILLFILSGISVIAQDYDGVWSFINKYNTVGKEHLEMIGKPIPSFNFNKKLNSKALRGTYYILDYWASWCVPCRELVKDIDSVLVCSPDFDKTVQVIGVDCGERNSAAAHAFWQKGAFLSLW